MRCLRFSKFICLQIVISNWSLQIQEYVFQRSVCNIMNPSSSKRIPNIPSAPNRVSGIVIEAFRPTTMLSLIIFTLPLKREHGSPEGCGMMTRGFSNAKYAKSLYLSEKLKGILALSRSLKTPLADSS